MYRKEREIQTRHNWEENLNHQSGLDLSAFLTPLRQGPIRHPRPNPPIESQENKDEIVVRHDGKAGVGILELDGQGRETIMESEENYVITPSGVRVSVPVDGRRLGWDHPFVHHFEGDARVWVLEKPKRRLNEIRGWDRAEVGGVSDLDLGLEVGDDGWEHVGLRSKGKDEHGKIGKQRDLGLSIANDRI